MCGRDFESPLSVSVWVHGWVGERIGERDFELGSLDSSSEVAPLTKVYIGYLEPESLLGLAPMLSLVQHLRAMLHRADEGMYTANAKV